MDNNHPRARQPHPAELSVALVLIAALLPVTLAWRALARLLAVMSRRRPLWRNASVVMSSVKASRRRAAFYRHSPGTLTHTGVG